MNSLCFSISIINNFIFSIIIITCFIYSIYISSTNVVASTIDDLSAKRWRVSVPYHKELKCHSEFVKVTLLPSPQCWSDSNLYSKDFCFSPWDDFITIGLSSQYRSLTSRTCINSSFKGHINTLFYSRCWMTIAVFVSGHQWIVHLNQNISTNCHFPCPSWLYQRK